MTLKHTAKASRPAALLSGKFASLLAAATDEFAEKADGELQTPELRRAQANRPHAVPPPLLSLPKYESECSGNRGQKRCRVLSRQRSSSEDPRTPESVHPPSMVGVAMKRQRVLFRQPKPGNTLAQEEFRRLDILGSIGEKAQRLSVASSSRHDSKRHRPTRKLPTVKSSEPDMKMRPATRVPRKRRTLVLSPAPTVSYFVPQFYKSPKQHLHFERQLVNCGW